MQTSLSHEVELLFKIMCLSASSNRSFKEIDGFPPYSPFNLHYFTFNPSLHLFNYLDSFMNQVGMYSPYAMMEKTNTKLSIKDSHQPFPTYRRVLKPLQQATLESIVAKVKQCS